MQEGPRGVGPGRGPLRLSGGGRTGIGRRGGGVLRLRHAGGALQQRGEEVVQQGRQGRDQVGRTNI